MSSLDKFLKPIEVADKLINKDRQAYRMDGDPDMRTEAGLGTCHCCDYFTISATSNRNIVILIEKTRLADTKAQIKKLAKKYPSLSNDDREKLNNEDANKENQLKVYASMLVLCRLSTKYKDVKNVLQEKRYQFWLVASDANKEEDLKYLDRRISYLSNALKGSFKKIIEDVKIIPSDHLLEKLSEYATTP